MIGKFHDDQPMNVLARLRSTIWPRTNPGPAYPLTLDHGAVAHKVRERMLSDDLIWMFGTPSERRIVHTVLTTQSGKLITDAWENAGGEFLGWRGYSDKSSGKTYVMLGLISIGELYRGNEIPHQAEVVMFSEFEHDKFLKFMDRVLEGIEK